MDATFLTKQERIAQEALDQFEADAVSRRTSLQAELDRATKEADAVRQGLFFGRGDELKASVATVLRAVGFEVEDLDQTFQGGRSADLLGTTPGSNWLVETRATGGPPSERDVDDLLRHLRTWSSLDRAEVIDGGVFIINHNTNTPPLERPPAAYYRPEFVSSLPVTVIASLTLYGWWAARDYQAIIDAVTGPPKQYPGSSPG